MATSPTGGRRPYTSTGPAHSSKEELLEELIASEERYVNGLNTFREGFIDKIRQRDTEDRRKLCYGHKEFTTSMDLLLIMYSHNTRLLEALKAANNDLRKVAIAFLRFAPAYHTYAQYAANMKESDEGMEKIQATLNKYLRDHPIAFGVNKYLGLPVDRMQSYFHYLHQLKLLAGSQANMVDVALLAIEKGLNYIEAAVVEHERRRHLLELQSQFLGYVDLYAPTRRLLKEGTLRKIYLEKGKKPEERHVHLFNDAMIYSSVLIGPYKYKAAKIFDLVNIDNIIPVADDSAGFIINFADRPGIRFQAVDVASAHEWMEAIDMTVRAAKKARAAESAGKAQEDAETRVNVVSFLQKYGLQTLDHLPERTRTIIFGLKADLTYIEYLKIFARVVVKTVEEMSYGIASVSGANIRTSKDMNDADRAKGLFETSVKAYSQATEGTMSRMRAQEQSRPLQSSDMAVFLKLVPLLEGMTHTLVEQVEDRIGRHVSTGVDLCIGDIYQEMAPLWVAYTTYASTMYEATTVLSSPALADVIGSMSEELAPLTVDQHINAPMEAIARNAVQLKAVLELTPIEHPDYEPLAAAVGLASATEHRMQKNFQDSRNYRILVNIRESIISAEVKDPRLDTLITSERKLVKQGELVKICRSKNKPYQVWLFNDCLIYAVALPGGVYHFNRWMQLVDMQAVASRDVPCGVDLLSTEKSFTMIAPDDAFRNSWVKALTKTIAEAKVAQGISPDAELKVAPILENTTEKNECTICHEKFTLFKRKQHCLKCGSIVCDACSPHRFILPNINKTQKQRVCNDCVAGRPHETTAVSSPRNDLASREEDEDGSRKSRGMLAGVVTRAGNTAINAVTRLSQTAGNYDEDENRQSPRPEFASNTTRTSSPSPSPRRSEPTPVSPAQAAPAQPRVTQDNWDALNSFYGPTPTTQQPPAQRPVIQVPSPPAPLQPQAPITVALPPPPQQQKPSSPRRLSPPPQPQPQQVQPVAPVVSPPPSVPLSPKNPFADIEENPFNLQYPQRPNTTLQQPPAWGQQQQQAFSVPFGDASWGSPTQVDPFGQSAFNQQPEPQPDPTKQMASGPGFRPPPAYDPFADL